MDDGKNRSRQTQVHFAGVWQKMKGFPKLSFLIVVLFILNGIFGSLFLPHDPTVQSLADRFLPPLHDQGGVQYLLGTDHLGRDILSRTLFGGRISLLIALLAIAVGGALGTFLGILAGYFGKKLEKVIMSLSDASLAFPSILLALLLSISIGPGVVTAVVAISFLMWSKYTRTIKTEVRTLKQRNFIVQSRLMGASNFFIIRRHVLPNIFNVVVVLVSLEVGMAILTESALSFLGLSVAPPMPSWGQMISDGNKYFLNAWWISVFPAAATAATVLSFINLGEWMKKHFGKRV
jgi:peptide/nickel transport system permease protein